MTKVIVLAMNSQRSLEYEAQLKGSEPQIIVYCADAIWTYLLATIVRQYFKGFDIPPKRGLLQVPTEMSGLPAGVVVPREAGASYSIDYMIEPSPGPPIENSTAFDVFGSYRDFRDRFRARFGEDPGWAAIQAASAGVLLTQALRGEPQGNLTNLNILQYLQTPSVVVATPLGVLNYTSTGQLRRIPMELAGARQFRTLGDGVEKITRYKDNKISMLSDEAVNSSDPITARTALVFPRPAMTHAIWETYPCEGGCQPVDDACRPCPPGRYREPVSVEDPDVMFLCRPCPRGYFATMSGMHSCNAPPEHTVILDAGASLASEPGFYLTTHEVEAPSSSKRCSIAQSDDREYEIYVEECHPSFLCVGGVEVCLGRNTGPVCSACEVGDTYMGILVDRHTCETCPPVKVLALHLLLALIPWVLNVLSLATLSIKAAKKPNYMPFLMARTFFHMVQVASIAYEASGFTDDEHATLVIYVLFLSTRQMEVLMLDCWAYALGIESIDSSIMFMRIFTFLTIPVGILFVVIAYAIFTEVLQSVDHLREILFIMAEVHKQVQSIENAPYEETSAKLHPRHRGGEQRILHHATTCSIQESELRIDEGSVANTTSTVRFASSVSRVSEGKAIPDASSTASASAAGASVDPSEDLEIFDDEHPGEAVRKPGCREYYQAVKLHHRQISAGLSFMLIIGILVNVTVMSQNFDALIDFEDTEADLSTINITHKITLWMSFTCLIFCLIFDRAYFHSPTSVMEVLITIMDVVDMVLLVFDFIVNRDTKTRKLVFLLSYIRLLRITSIVAIFRHLLEGLAKASGNALKKSGLVSLGQGNFILKDGILEGKELHSQSFTVDEAKIVAAGLKECKGFCFKVPIDANNLDDTQQTFTISFRDSDQINFLDDDVADDSTWHSYVYADFNQEMGIGASFADRMVRLHHQRAKMYRLPIIVSWVLVSFPAVLRMLLRLESCMLVGAKNLSKYDTRVECTSDLPMFSMIIGILVPVLVYLAAGYARRLNLESMVTRKKFGALIIGYTWNSWYWEALILAVLTLLCWANQIKAAMYRMFAMIVAVALQYIATCFVHPMAPYARDTIYNLERLGLLHALMILGGSQIIVEEIVPDAAAVYVVPYLFQVKITCLVLIAGYFSFTLCCQIISLKMEMIRETGGSVGYINRLARYFDKLLKSMRGVNPVYVDYKDGHQVLDVSELSKQEKHLLSDNLARLICAALEFEGGLHVRAIEALIASAFANAQNSRVQELRSIYEQHGLMSHAIQPCCACFTIAVRAPDVPVNDVNAHSATGVSIEELIMAVNEILQDIVNPMVLTAELRRPQGTDDLMDLCDLDEEEAQDLHDAMEQVHSLEVKHSPTGTRH